MQRRRDVQSHHLPPAQREFVSGESVLYIGRHYRLKVHPNETGKAKLRGGWLHVPAPGYAQQTAHVRDALISWLRRHAGERLPERVAAWRTRAGLGMPRVVIADQQKRWGSYDRNGTIRLNWRIIQAPMRLVDYVVVHELVRLRHRGHGRDYWQAFGKVMPDYERRREELRRRGVQWTGRSSGTTSADGNYALSATRPRDVGYHPVRPSDEDATNNAAIGGMNRGD